MSGIDRVSIIAGSVAGIGEHLLVYPVDTVKTHLQTTKTSAHGLVRTFTTLLKGHGFGRLWRGVSVQVAFCGPAHALMFLSYERVKIASSKLLEKWEQPSNGKTTAITGCIAGCVSTFFHDIIMVPADTVKSRLQLGYYRGTKDAVQKIIRGGGGSFFRAFGTTLVMNIPYGAVMMTTNEYTKYFLGTENSENFPLVNFLISGGTAGALAGAITTPLDVCRTRLQTQSLLPKDLAGVGANCLQKKPFKILYRGLRDVAGDIAKKEGWKGFTNGLTSRVVMGAPACAISWLIYEVCKEALQ